MSNWHFSNSFLKERIRNTDRNEYGKIHCRKTAFLLSTSFQKPMLMYLFKHLFDLIIRLILQFTYLSWRHFIKKTTENLRNINSAHFPSILCYTAIHTAESYQTNFQYLRSRFNTYTKQRLIMLLIVTPTVVVDKAPLKEVELWFSRWLALEEGTLVSRGEEIKS